jgi:hypothetical protein
LKSILFTHFREKLLDRTKQQTTRIIYIPRYHVQELVMLRFKESEIRIDDLFVVKITEIFPIQMKAATLDIAERDGFDSVREYQEGLAEINHRKFNDAFLEDWGFVTRWKDAKQPMTKLEEFIPDFFTKNVAKPEFHEGEENE